MKCFAHNGLDATATCQGCNKGLCVDCSSRFNVTLCEFCLLSHNRSVEKEMYKGLAITIFIFSVVTYYIGDSWWSSDNENLIIAWFPGIILAFTYWGWKFLSEHAFRLQGANIGIWLIYLMFKFFIAYFIGILVGPYQIFRMLKEIRVARKTKRQITRGEL